MSPQTAPSSTEDPRIASAEDDARLIARIRGGVETQAAYSELVEKYWRVVIGWVLPRVPGPRDAEEVAQEAFIKAFRALAKLDCPRSFLAWLLRIATNSARDLTRSRRTHLSIDELADSGRGLAATQGPIAAASQPVPGVEEALEEEEDLDHALEAVALLPAKYRLVLTLRYQSGLSPKEIAARLHEPEGTIRNRIFRALEKVRERLERQAAVATAAATRRSRSLDTPARAVTPARTPGSTST